MKYLVTKTFSGVYEFEIEADNQEAADLLAASAYFEITDSYVQLPQYEEEPFNIYIEEQYVDGVKRADEEK